MALKEVIHIKIQFHSKEKESISKRKRSLIFLIAGIVLLLGTGAIVYYIDPAYKINFLNYPLSLLPVFLILVFTTLFFLSSYAFKSKTHGVLIGMFVITYLIFRLNGLTHPFFFILLFALFLTLELFVSYRR